MDDCEDLPPEMEELKFLEKKNTTVTIAVTGDTGCGKSALVNALRGISDGDEGAAPVGVEETTVEPTEYSYPNNPKVRIWDLPGIGSSKYDQYVKKVDFERFDFFIIVAEVQFRENEAKLALEIQKMKKKFYFIRSKIDNDLRDAERSQRDKDETLQEIKDDCIKSLEELNVESPKVFLVSAPERHLYDFTLFCETLEKDLPELQRDALLLAVPDSSLDIIKKKKTNVHELVLVKAALSAGVAGTVVLLGLYTLAEFLTSWPFRLLN